jgi:acyl carrier protein
MSADDVRRRTFLGATACNPDRVSLDNGGLALLSQDEFVASVARELGIDQSELISSSFEELGFDSLQFFEMDLIVEDLGALLSDEEITAAQTIRDLYRAYCRVITDADGVREGRPRAE